MIANLNNLRYYSFVSLMRILMRNFVWALAYQKAHHPREFWISTLNHCCSMYKSWVHMCEAKKHGIRLTLGKRH